MIEPNFADRSEAFLELERLADECSLPGWDAHSAVAISAETVAAARAFLQGLSPLFPSPSLAADPDGDISFEWYFGDHRLFSLSLSASGEFVYCGRLAGTFVRAELVAGLLVAVHLGDVPKIAENPNKTASKKE